jgi:hypothetical protein
VSVVARAGPARGDEGFATAEVAVALPALVLVLAAALRAVAATGAQVACVDAARAGARAAARGESLAAVRAAVLRAAPAGARATIGRGADVTRVEVSARIGRAWGLALPPVTVSAAATSATEPGVDR